MIEALTDPIRNEEVGILFHTDGNPHILRTGFREVDDQIDRLTKNFQWTCAYPRNALLKGAVDESQFDGEPYKLALALGEIQMAFRSFDLSVLEFYRNDPRYLYHNDDVFGNICISDEYYLNGSMAESDKILLKTFGFSYDEEMNRAVAVYLRYLSRLSPEHQQIWRAKELTDDCTLHLEYYNSSVLGEFRTHISIHDAFLAELYVINCMADAMGRKPLFRQDYGQYLEGKPEKFCFLIRPTASEFDSYVHLLDKLLSDNINVHFFGDDVERERDVVRSDGKIEVKNKFSIQILNEWVGKTIILSESQPWEDSVNAIKRVRKLRQKPAHSVRKDCFDQKYFKDQRDLIQSAYKAVRIIRLLLANHPRVKAAAVDVPRILFEGNILDH